MVSSSYMNEKNTLISWFNTRSSFLCQQYTSKKLQRHKLRQITSNQVLCVGMWGSGVQSQPWLYWKFQVALHETLSQSKARQKQQCLTSKNILTYRLLEQFWGVANWKICWSLEISKLHTLLMVCNAHCIIIQLKTLWSLINSMFLCLWTTSELRIRFSRFAQTHSRELISLNTKDEWSIQVVNYFKNYSYIWCT